MRQTSMRITLLCAIALIFCGKLDICADEPTVEDIVKMWSERQSAAKSVMFHWGETVLPEDPQADEQNAVRERRDYRLRLGDDANMRSESILLLNLDEPGESLTRTGFSVSAFNGKRNAYFTSAVDPDGQHRGIEFDAKVYDEIVNYHLRAMILSYRPLLVVRSQFLSKESELIRQESELSIVDRDATLDGTPCLIVESRTKPVDPVLNRYWVDMNRGGLILKHAEIVSGRTTAEMKITYKKDSTNGWVPAIWNGRFLNTSFRSVVIDYTINQPLKPEIFQIAYPAGTVVFDRNRGKRWRMLDDGSRELITPKNREE